MKISVNCPSYKRPYVETLEYLDFVKVWVCESEYDNYISQNKGFEKNIIKVPLGVQGNLCRIRNYILKTELEKGYDVVVIIDDDMKEISYWENGKDIKLEGEDFLPFIEKYSIMCNDLGFKFWGVNVNQDRGVYREYTPFSTTSYIGGPFQVFLKGNECFYDERLPLKEDYDMTIQQMNKYRGALRVNKYHYNVKQSKQSGGCATIRNYEKEKSQLDILTNKWGSKIVKIDKLGKKNSKFIDYNPIIKIPIKGV